LKNKKNINNGPVFWTEPASGYGNLYIPTSQNIYKFSGQDFFKLETVGDSDGLLYVSFYNGFLYYNDLIKKSVKRLNPEFGTTTEDIFELNNVAFMPPYVSGNYIMIIDSSGTAYRSDSTKISKTPDKVELKSGVMSNMIIKSGFLYFIDNKGFFSRMNVGSFISAEFIAKVDNETDKDKFLTKKIIEYEGKIFYCSEKGNLFSYDTKNNEYVFLNADKNSNLTGTPSVIDNQLYLFDVNGNMYKLQL
jgi:hypothetical protein